MINKNLLLLDTCNTHSVGCNFNTLINLRKCTDDRMLYILINCGSLVYDKIGESNILPVAMNYNPHSIANGLSLSMIAKIPGARLTMDTEAEKSIIVRLDGVRKFKFKECADGLYYYDTSESNNTNSSVNNYSNLSSFKLLINSVSNNKK